MVSNQIIPIGRSKLDLDSKPIPATSPTGQQVSRISAYDRRQTHPGYGLSTSRIWLIYRNAEAGNIQAQCDLFEDTKESDGHYSSLYDGRMDAVAGKEMVFQAGCKSECSSAALEAFADDVDVDTENFVEFVTHQLSAEFYGFAASEIIWAFSERTRRWYPERFVNVPHRRFCIGEGNELRLLTAENRWKGEPLVPGKWVISRGRQSPNLARSGAMRTATWWSHFKRISVRDLLVLSAKFGIPHVTGVYEERASDAAKEALAKAVSDLGEAGQAILEETTRIIISEVDQGKGDSQIQPAIISLCNSEMSKLVNGATLNVEGAGAGSYAQATVHGSRSHVKDVAAALRVGRTFRSQLSSLHAHFNGFTDAGAKPAKLKVQLVQELDQRTRLALASTFANELGGDIDETQLRDELGLRKPVDSDNTLKGTLRKPVDSDNTLKGTKNNSEEKSDDDETGE